MFMMRLADDTTLYEHGRQHCRQHLTYKQHLVAYYLKQMARLCQHRECGKYVLEYAQGHLQPRIHERRGRFEWFRYLPDKNSNVCSK
jgi:hypothetical protein